MGALTQLYAGTMPEAAELGGKVTVSVIVLSSCILNLCLDQYLIPWARVGEAKKETNDPKIAQELWAWLESQVQNV